MEILEKKFASELIESFDALINLKLKDRLSDLNNSKNSAHNIITISRLNKLELDLLKDSFKIVNSFKKFIVHHFRCDIVS